MVEVPAGSGLDSAADIVLDNYGIPHISASSETDLAFGLGFVHARDRLFQLELLRHAAQGRLAELFGEDLLATDRRFRVISDGIDEQVRALAPRDKAIFEAYAHGVNAGADHAGRSAEMFLLGITFEPFAPRDSLSIFRLQVWTVSAGWRTEITLAEIVAQLGSDDPRTEAFLDGSPSGGVPIVTGTKMARGGVQTAGPPEAAAWRRLLAPGSDKSSHRPTRLAQSVESALGLAGLGASNSWVVSGAHTKSGYAVLCNDPHLAHRAPGIFYLAHLRHPEFSVVGATVPGIPAVLIGASQHAAWGMTAALNDTQDLVRLTPDPDHAYRYLVGGSSHTYEPVIQTFRLGHGPGAKTVHEVWRRTIFGPVLPKEMLHGETQNEQLALQWIGYRQGGPNRMLASGLWDLARARNLAEAEVAVAKFRVASMSLVLAFTDGTIAYRLASGVPLRSLARPSYLPISSADGATTFADWLPAEASPQLTNPARGYIVAANQRVEENDVVLGRFAAPASRAMRINQRLRTLLASGPATADQLLAVQQDIVSDHAPHIAALLGSLCPKSLPDVADQLLADFCARVGEFDGTYSVDSMSALPYTALLTAMRIEVLMGLGHGESEATKHEHDIPVRVTVTRALRAHASGGESPIFRLPGRGYVVGLRHFVRLATKRALAALLERAGDDPENWRWGRLHLLAPKNPLASAPLVGGWFESEPVEQAGHSDTPRAEGGIPIAHGSVLRFVAEMTTPPTIRMVTDTGNSGHVGAEHWNDQRQAWQRGEPLTIALDDEAIAAQTAGRLRLRPKVSGYPSRP